MEILDFTSAFFTVNFQLPTVVFLPRESGLGFFFTFLSFSFFSFVEAVGSGVAVSFSILEEIVVEVTDLYSSTDELHDVHSKAIQATIISTNFFFIFYLISIIFFVSP